MTDSLPIAPPLLALLDASQQFYSVFDEHDVLRYANATFRAVFELQEDATPTWAELIRTSYLKNIGVQIETANIDAWLASALARRGKTPYRTIESNLRDGRWLIWAETTLPNGWMMCTATDITNLAVDTRSLRYARDQANKLSLTDELTSLGNRRYVLEKLETLLHAPETDRLCVVMFDLDSFKNINDTYGHAVGDAVIQDFAGLLRASSRRNDVCGRVGGEEFLLVLVGVGLEEAQMLVARLFESVRASRPVAHLAQLRYTCSAGIAVFSPGDQLDPLLHRADAALYRAKDLGREKCHWA